MAYPPGTVAANKAAGQSGHPAHHNELAAAVNDIVGRLGGDLNRGAPYFDVDLGDFGAMGTSNDSATIQAAIDAVSAVNPGSDLGEGTVRINGTDRTVFVEDTLKVGRRTKLELSEGVELRRVTSTTGPVVRLQANSAKFDGKVRSDVALTDGIVRIGPETTGAVQWCQVRADIHGPGAAIAGSVGLVLAGTATFQNTVLPGSVIHDAETGVLDEAGANANEFVAVQMFNIGTVAWLMRAGQWFINGGLVHSSAGITILKAEGSFKGAAILRGEPGSPSVPYDLDAGCNRVNIWNLANTSAVGVDLGTDTKIIAPPSSAAYTPTNVTTDRTFDANATTIDELADVLATLIADLQAQRLLG